MQPNGKRTVLLAVVAMFVMVWLSRGANDRGSLSGVVKDASGKPAVGAMVKIRNTARGLTFMVISQDQGRYQSTNLPPGEYTVQALGGGFKSGPDGEVALAAGKGTTQNLGLTVAQSFEETMTSAQFGELMPEDQGKGVIVRWCTDCHGLEKIVPLRRSAELWRETVTKMRNSPYGNRRSAALNDEDAELVIAYLSKHFGPDVPPLDKERNIPKNWLRGAATKYWVLEYALGRGRGPHDVAVDSHGICWVGEGGAGEEGGAEENAALGRFDPETLTYKRIPIPGEKKAGASALSVDPQDRIWFSDRSNKRIAYYDPKTDSFVSFPLPKPARGGDVNLNTIRFHPDGSVWGTELSANQIVRIDPVTKKVTEYVVPTSRPGRAFSVNPYGMAIDGKGMIWFAERYAGKVGRVDPATGQITEYDVPTRDAQLRRMGTDEAGNLWFGESGAGSLGMVDYRTGKVVEIPTPTKYSGAYSVDVDKSKNFIWMGYQIADKLGRFDPRTKTFTEYPLPNTYVSTRRIAVDPSRPNRVWYAGFYSDSVGFVEVMQ